MVCVCAVCRKSLCMCVKWCVLFPCCTLHVMFYGVPSSSMSDVSRNSRLSPHSTGKPRKTIVGCWRSLNFDPENMKFSCDLADLGAAGMLSSGTSGTSERSVQWS